MNLNYLISKEDFELYVEELIGNIQQFLTPYPSGVDLDQVLNSYYVILSGKAIFVDINREEKELMVELAFDRVKKLFGR